MAPLCDWVFSLYGSKEPAILILMAMASVGGIVSLRTNIHPAPGAYFGSALVLLFLVAFHC